ncbi:hypothetical protein SDC9_138729 [bioreactor metagenome]|uniref:Uncharacterized protein n=1 Tax=bioreactor metagenome TaxID=1076179 RepID=A0A645DR39_9ZZZZ
MIQTAETAGRNQNHRQLPLRREIDGQKVFGQRHRQSARAFEQHNFVIRVQMRNRRVDLRQIEGAVFQLRRQMGRGREAEDLGHGPPRLILRQKAALHQLAVAENIFGQPGVAGLHQLDGDHPAPGKTEKPRHHAEGDAFADIGIDPADLINAHDFDSRVFSAASQSG